MPALRNPGSSYKKEVKEKKKRDTKKQTTADEAVVCFKFQ
jgi:hypothetical protein